MKFTAWQIDKLIRGLHSYRVMKAVNARLAPWKSVLDHLLLSPETAHQYPADGSEPEFKEEALRRFAAGISTLEAAKMADVASFLIAERILTPGELSEDAGFMAEGLILHTYLATKSPAGAERLSQLVASYSCANAGTYETEHLELRFVAQPTENLVGVEECVTVKAARGTPGKKDVAKAAGFARKGYAFTSSPHGTFHVFLRGGSPDDYVHYVSVTDPRGPSALSSLPLLLRSGPLPRISHTTSDPIKALLSARGLNVASMTVTDDQARQVLEASNILSFTPTDERRIHAAPSPKPPPQEPTEGGAMSNFMTDPESDPVVLGHQLIEATRERAFDLVARAIAEGADVNVQDAHGMTALHHAAAHGARPCIRILVGSGKCDYLIRDHMDRYAFEIADEWARDYAVARLLAKKQLQQAAARGVPAYEPRT